ncbi:MAG: glycosyltransferase family 1 protein [Fimbriiglobus sp.]|jgi:glycosyltransferase involved in cell wall biosynthesis|nr:glycosyltransferase family 1 protein [Fimbriiglobus sp.]
MSRIILATDAWYPQVNGVVRTIDMTARTLRAMGHTVEIIEPTGLLAIGVPFYPEIRLCFPRTGPLYKRILKFNPDHVHITTEGPLGLAVRQFCRNRNWAFSTSYHTKFPEYLRRLAFIPESWSYPFLRWFHSAADPMMTATPSLEAELRARGFNGLHARWSRGVDLTQFRPRPKAASAWPAPVLLYVGRVSNEKNIEAFLKLDTPGTKVVVGDGPARLPLQGKYPAAKFLGYQKGEALAECYAQADLFVFPSLTDTFGLVVIEALASGVPVAAFPATGPVDIITRPELGACDDDLGKAVTRALATGVRAECIEEAKKYTWENCTRQFIDNLVLVNEGHVPPPRRWKRKVKQKPTQA